MGIPVVTREYNPRACRNSKKPMRLPPHHEMRPDSPALHAEQLSFRNQTHKDPRFAWWNSTSPKNTVTRWGEHWCHLKNAKLIGVPQINSRWSTFPLHWIHSRLSLHIIYNKCLDILYNNPEIPLDTHLKSIGTSISVKQQDEKPGHPISYGDESWFPVFEWRGKPSFHKHLKRRFPLGICTWEGPCVLCF